MALSNWEYVELPQITGAFCIGLVGMERESTRNRMLLLPEANVWIS